MINPGHTCKKITRFAVRKSLLTRLGDRISINKKKRSKKFKTRVQSQMEWISGIGQKTKIKVNK
jgi:hypothetical protein